jgi:hypothetical protein
VKAHGKKVYEKMLYSKLLFTKASKNNLLHGKNVLNASCNEDSWNDQTTYRKMYGTAWLLICSEGDFVQTPPCAD